MKRHDFETDYLSRQCHLSNCLELWNDVTPSPFQISEKLFHQNVVTQSSFDLKASLMIYEASDLVGFILIKTWRDGVPWLVETVRQAHISLLCVDPKRRRQGYGRLLVSHAISMLKAQGIERLELGKELYTFLPGLPECFHEYTPFFTEMGFTDAGITYDMIRNIDAYTTSLPLKREGLIVRRAKRYDFKRIEQFLANEFPGRWHHEFICYRDKGGSGKEFIIALENQKVVAFCRLNGPDSIEQGHNVNWSLGFKRLHGIGPLGVAGTERGRGLGYLITAFAFNEAVQAQADAVVIDWTSKVSFYEKFGFRIWQTYRSMGMALKG